MDPGVIQMLSKVDGASKTEKKGPVDLQEFYAKMQGQLDVNLDPQTNPQLHSEQQMLGDRFDVLMNADQTGAMQPLAPNGVSDNPSAIRMVITEQDHVLQNTLSDIKTFETDLTSGQLNMAGMVNGFSTVMTGLGTVALNSGAHVGFEKGAQRAFDTLYKNQ